MHLNRAFLELIEADYSMPEIAMRNGFPDVCAFTNIFRKEYGMTSFHTHDKRTGRIAKREWGFDQFLCDWDKMYLLKRFLLVFSLQGMTNQSVVKLSKYP